MKTIPSTEERVWAVLSHLSALAFGMGLLIPIVAWSDQRRKSNHASFQALQALGYQSLGFTVWLLLYLLLLVLFVILLLIVGALGGGQPAVIDSFTNIGMVVIFLILFGSLGIYLLLPIIAAVACALGHDFRYPILGKRLARYLHYDPERITAEPVWLFEENESHWVAAMGHFSVIIMFWSLLAPATALIMHGRRSRFLKFQSIQTLIYQTIVTLVFIGGMALYVLGFLFALATLSTTSGPTLESPASMIGLTILLVTLLIALLVLLVVPLFHVLGQWAGYRVLKGADYHYLLIGWLTERWFLKNDPVEEEEIPA